MFHDPALLHPYRQIQQDHIRRVAVDLINDCCILHIHFTGIGAYHPQLRLHFFAVMLQFFYGVLIVCYDIQCSVLFDEIFQHHPQTAVAYNHITRFQSICMMRCQQCLFSRQKQIRLFKEDTVFLIFHCFIQHFGGSKHNDIQMVIGQVFIHFSDKDVIAHHIHINIHDLY